VSRRLSNPPRPVLLVASTGGHLSEIVQLRPQVCSDRDAVHWVTFDSAQSRSSLRDADVTYMPDIPSRGYSQLLRNLPRALRVLAKVRPREVVSTGAGIALIFLPFAFLVGARAVYIESAARTEGPSFTGRVLALLPWVSVFTQFPHNAEGRWQYRYSVFSAVPSTQAPSPLPEGQPSRVLVLLGTWHFPFNRVVSRIKEICPPGVEITWQLGETVDPTLDQHSSDYFPEDELEEMAKQSTMIISHAGVGSALLALHAGVRPVLVPRQRTYGEHVDDHQVQLAHELEKLGVALCREVDELDASMFDVDYRFDEPIRSA
jgi:UDP-N-acetylglucosamine--N-acetylmuramyl-(pentapeptide) pyrophosphoryl-undecaprenol N-acetylglucosamine transferase